MNDDLINYTEIRSDVESAKPKVETNSYRNILDLYYHIYKRIFEEKNKALLIGELVLRNLYPYLDSDYKFDDDLIAGYISSNSNLNDNFQKLLLLELVLYDRLNNDLYNIGIDLTPEQFGSMYDNYVPLEKDDGSDWKSLLSDRDLAHLNGTEQNLKKNDRLFKTLGRMAKDWMAEKLTPLMEKIGEKYYDWTHKNETTASLYYKDPEMRLALNGAGIYNPIAYEFLSSNYDAEDKILSGDFTDDDVSKLLSPEEQYTYYLQIDKELPKGYRNEGLINVSPEFYLLTGGRAGMNGVLFDPIKSGFNGIDYFFNPTRWVNTARNWGLNPGTALGLEAMSEAFIKPTWQFKWGVDALKNINKNVNFGVKENKDKTIYERQGLSNTPGFYFSNPDEYSYGSLILDLSMLPLLYNGKRLVSGAKTADHVYNLMRPIPGVQPYRVPKWARLNPETNLFNYGNYVR